jgi:hypothetical protein
MRYRFCSVFLTLVLVLAFLSTALGLAACRPSPGSSGTTASQTSPAESEQTTAKAGESSAGQISGTKTNPALRPITHGDLAAEIEGKTYHILDEASGLIESLGEPIQFSEVPSTVYEGTDKTYEYADLIIYTITQDSKELIGRIDLVTGKWQTSRGIKVGSSAYDLLHAYGDPFSFEVDLVYVTDDLLGELSPGITFVMNDQVVTMISLYNGKGKSTE